VRGGQVAPRERNDEISTGMLEPRLIHTGYFRSNGE
jgi:hypothetical protein